MSIPARGWTEGWVEFKKKKKKRKKLQLHFLITVIQSFEFVPLGPETQSREKIVRLALCKVALFLIKNNQKSWILIQTTKIPCLKMCLEVE